MAHKQQIEYCIKIRSLFPGYFFRKRVLDIGSLDVNGNNRYLFWCCKYFGIDIGEGKNVDAVCAGHLFNAPDKSIDTIISTEVAEHDCFYEATMINAIRMLKDGGLLLFTCATTGRPEHGTYRTDMGSSPYTCTYYENVTEEMIRRIPGFNEAWEYCRFSVNDETHDLQLVAIKKGGTVNFNPSKTIYLIMILIVFYKMRVKDIKDFLKRLKNKLSC